MLSLNFKIPEFRRTPGFLVAVTAMYIFCFSQKSVWVLMPKNLNIKIACMMYWNMYIISCTWEQQCIFLHFFHFHLITLSSTGSHLYSPWLFEHKSVQIWVVLWWCVVANHVLVRVNVIIIVIVMIISYSLQRLLLQWL